MNIVEVKAKLNMAQLNLTVANDAKNQPTDWLRHWDNDNRVAVSLHKDTLVAIKADPTANLGLQTETRKGGKGDYVSHRIVKYSDENIVAVL